MAVPRPLIARLTYTRSRITVQTFIIETVNKLSSALTLSILKLIIISTHINYLKFLGL